MHRIHIISADESPLADTGGEISALLAQALSQTAGVELVSHVEEADSLVLIEPFSFKEWRYITALKSCPIVSKYAYKTYTVNFDDGASGLLKGVYAGLRESRYNPSIHRAVPYYRYPNKLIGPARPETVPDLLATYRGNPKSNKIRHQILARYAKHPRILVESTDSWMNHGTSEQQHYVDLLLRGKFALCPAGWAPVSFRIYEAMALQRCPVLIADEFVSPTFMDWSSFSIRIPEARIDDLQHILEQREPEADRLGKQARLAWERHCSPLTVWNHISASLLDCINQAPATTTQEEIRRWESFDMAWRNGWTLPQRLANKLRRITSRTTA